MGLRGDYRERYWAADPAHYGYRPPVGYLASVRHPWTSVLFVVPLLALYEFGVRKFSSEGGSLRAGVELWLQQWMAQESKWPPWAIPAAVVGLLLLWAMIRFYDRPDRMIIPAIGISFEGIACGIGIWALVMNAPMLYEKAGLPAVALNIQSTQALTFVGVGIYEEVIFRLIGFALLARLLRILFVPAIAAIPLAIVVSAVAFASAHHLVQSDPFVPLVFFTRVLIGAGLAIIFWLRGLGVAVCAHIVYDVVASAQVPK